MTPARGARNSVIGLLMAAAAVVANCSATSVSVAPSQTNATGGATPVGGRVLFIGNSLTEVNELPEVVETLSRQAGGTPISTASVVVGGFSLEDHWNQGTARRRIAEGGWSIVVLQQGPSSLPESQVNLRQWTARFDAVIRANGARTALYMVWPESDRLNAFDAVSRSYTRAAKTSTACCSPWARRGAEPGAATAPSRCTVRTGFIPLSPPPTWRRSLSADYWSVAGGPSPMVWDVGGPRAPAAERRTGRQCGIRSTLRRISSCARLACSP